MSKKISPPSYPGREENSHDLEHLNPQRETAEAASANSVVSVTADVKPITTQKISENQAPTIRIHRICSDPFMIRGHRFPKSREVRKNQAGNDGSVAEAVEVAYRKRMSYPKVGQKPELIIFVLQPATYCQPGHEEDQSIRSRFPQSIFPTLNDTFGSWSAWANKRNIVRDKTRPNQNRNPPVE